MFWTISAVVVGGVLVIAHRFDRRHGLRVGTGTRRGRGLDPTFGARASVAANAIGSSMASDGGQGSCGDAGGSSC
jgi:hypothetical protein